MADPDEALTGRESSAASAEASPALIEAIAEVMREVIVQHGKRMVYDHDWAQCRCSVTFEGDDAEDQWHQHFARETARAAYAAMVAHLGLVEEWAREIGPGVNRPMRRLVSRWVEVDHGSE